MGADHVNPDAEALQRRLTPAGDPIMTAKFLVPVVNAPMVQRGRLIDLMTACVAGPVTLISAPAGSGKTVLASSWVAAGAAPGPVAWISVDEEDDLPGVFWSYVVTGLERCGVDVRGVGTSDEPDSVDHSILVRLAARLSERADPVVLILDNAEGITRRQICDGLDFLVRHAAGNLRLVVVTRIEPNLPLPQYRLEGMVREIRFAELAFPPNEAKQLLAARRPEMSDSAVQAFSYRTRGWAAGLRLAEVSPANPGGVLADMSVLAASDIAVYFRTEVLESQPAPVRDFLLATSIADPLPPGLATHLSGLAEAGSTLRALAQSSLFVELGPGPEEAYRYHPLVRDLLTAQLRQQFPVRWRRLHRKAAQWFVAEGRTDDAVTHYAAAGDWEACASVLVRQVALGRLLSGRPYDPLAGAIARMPSSVSGPEAAVAAAAVAVVNGDLDACDKHLARAWEVVSAESANRDLELDLALALTTLARSAAAGGVRGQSAVQDAEQALCRVAALQWVDGASWALVAYGSGCAQLAGGELDAARQSLTAAVRAAQESDRPHLTALARGRLALTDALDGRLTEALAAAGSPGGVDEDDTESLAALSRLVAVAWVASERGDLAEAAEHARPPGASRRLIHDVVSSAALGLVRARLLRARGDLPGALIVLDRLIATSRSLPPWLEDRVSAAAAEVCTAQGRPDAAVERVQRRIAQGAGASLVALGWAKLPLGMAGESGRLARQVVHQSSAPLDLRVEAHLLAAASSLALGHAESASAALDEAGRLAAPERLRRPFDEGPRRLRALLQQRSEHPSGAAAGSGSGGQPMVPTATQPEELIVQPLTEREREVLGYLDALLPTDEIAMKMFVSVNTVKTHVRAILRKLSAERRNEAVRRARELGLL
jgi:LuxR family transcriptional regulator, maltose regulon positive regulatory protein